MLFNSYEFILFFLPVTFLIYFYLNTKKFILASKAFLIFTSLFFYSWWNIIYLPLILSSMLFNYVIGNMLSSKNDFLFRKKILIVAVAANLALLGYYKYSDFFLENINYIFQDNFELLHLTLPLAISFFTFQQISYLVDSYKKEIKEYDFLNYALFVTFFPQLIAGPIVHHKEMMPQFANLKNKFINHSNITAGLFIFAVGLFKKTVIADTLASWATYGFDHTQVLGFIEAWAASLSYTFELYFDFSGYTDMAIGAALLFNIHLPKNFNSPYKALCIQDFWHRWHMTLSRFLKDYIYIPLGGNKRGSKRTYFNLFITFLLGGIWHGAGWTFVIWGVLHGIAIIIHRIWQRFEISLGKIFSWLLTFLFINITWVFFRANNFTDALKVLKGMFFVEGFQDRNNFIDEKALLFIFLLFLISLFTKNSNEIAKNFSLNTKYAILGGVLSGIGLTIMAISSGSEFLYFNF